MMLWPFKYMPSYGDACPHCGYWMLKAPQGLICAMLTCRQGAKNHEAAKG